MGRKSYTEEQKRTALACLLSNGGNLAKTERETGIQRGTLRAWQKTELMDSPEITTLKKELADNFTEKLKRTRSRLIDRIYEEAEHESDLFKLSGAFKTVMEAASDDEVNRALAARISGAAETEAPPAPQDAGSAHASAPGIGPN